MLECSIYFLVEQGHIHYLDTNRCYIWFIIGWLLYKPGFHVGVNCLLFASWQHGNTSATIAIVPGKQKASRDAPHRFAATSLEMDRDQHATIVPQWKATR